MNAAATGATSHLHRRPMLPLVAATLCLAAIAADARPAASAGDLKVFTTRAIGTVLQKIGRDVERNTGRKLTVTTDVAIRLVRRVKAGEAFDLLVAAPGQIDELVAGGMIVRETRTDIARSGIGVAVRRGAAKPDVSSRMEPKSTFIIIGGIISQMRMAIGTLI